MHSIQGKTTVLTIAAIIVAMITATVIGVLSIVKIGNSNSEQLLRLLCETGEKNINRSFESVEQAVSTVSDFIEANLDSITLDRFDEHIEKTKELFSRTASRTTGTMTFYYRIDPDFADFAMSYDDRATEPETGYWFVDTDGNGFEEHPVTDLRLALVQEDKSGIVWFTVPKETGEAFWLPSYITENLNVRVISYNNPIYRNGVFVGVVGIEISNSVIEEQVKSITLYDHGYAFINDYEGNIVYHPFTNVLELTEDQKIKIPTGIVSENDLVVYDYNGVKKMAVWRALDNGTRLNVSVPVSEINGNWQRLMYYIILATVIVLAVFIVLTIVFTRHFTKPLRKLTEAAEKINDDNYDVKLDYSENDEIGVLSKTFNKLITHLKGYIADLNSLAYGDALTSVRNKGAFEIFKREMQTRMNDENEQPEFAIGIFDCDGLKQINDKYGHDKGDIYLKNSSHLICRVFMHSAVFRVGGDEFAAVLIGEDYENRDALLKEFFEKSAEISAFANREWEKICVSAGIAEFDPRKGRSIDSVIRRADKMMYENKRQRKN